jgi:hypothetical protein|tara:strand:- start:2965 stop:3198 length:234 start_codon:yes stop_codon:yes gene_type:complete
METDGGCTFIASLSLFLKDSKKQGDIKMYNEQGIDLSDEYESILRLTIKELKDIMEKIKNQKEELTKCLAYLNRYKI